MLFETVSSSNATPSAATPAALNNNNNKSSDSVTFDVELTLKIIGVLSLILIIVVGNSMVMLAVRLDRTILALSQSSFLFSMALADALVGVFVVPMALIQIIYEYWPLPPFLCIIYRCLDVALCTASILHLCAISMDRFWSLRIDYTRHHRARNMRIMIIVVWLLSLVICLPSALPSKFDLQYLGSYLPATSDEDDRRSVLSASSGFFISPFYILDNQNQAQAVSSEPLTTTAVTTAVVINRHQAGGESSPSASSSSLSSPPYLHPTTNFPTTAAYLGSPTVISVPYRPRGNNKVLQSLDDVGIDCSGPTPFDLLFPAYPDENPKNSHDSQPCIPAVMPDNKEGDIDSAAGAAAVGSSAVAAADINQDDYDSSLDDGLYHCTLINDIFYTFASASASFYVPLIITVIMNVLTFWIAKRTAKAAIKRMHTTNPAALMLRAAIPMPMKEYAVRRRSTNFSTTIGSGGVLIDDDATTYFRTSTVLLVDRMRQSDTQTQTSLQNNKYGAIDGYNNGNGNNDDETTNVNYNNSNSNMADPVTTSASPNVEVPTNIDELGNTVRKVTSLESIAGMNASEQVLQNGGLRLKSDDSSHRNSTKDNRCGNGDAATVEARQSLLEQGQQPTNNGGQQLTTKNLISSVLQNVALFNSSRTTVVAAKKIAHQYDRTVHAVRLDKKRRAKQRERKAAVVLIIVTVTFIVCWLPFFSIFPLTRIVPPGVIPGPIFDAAVWLGYVNSAVNPVIYTIFNEEFRRAFANIFLCRWKMFGRY